MIGKTEYQGHTLSSQTDLWSFECDQVQLIDELLASLSSHFQVDEILLKASSVVKLELWPVRLADQPGVKLLLLVIYIWEAYIQLGHAMNVTLTEPI